MRMDFFSTSSCMNFDKIIFITYIYIYTYVYIYIYFHVRQNQRKQWYEVLVCSKNRVLPSRLLYGVPPHQIPLKPPNLQLWTPDLLPLLPIPSASKELFLALILWKITDSNTTQWSDNEQCGGLRATETSGIQSTNGLGAWWFGIWIGVPQRNPIPFIFGDSRNPNHQDYSKQNTHIWELNLMHRVPENVMFIYIILEKISWSCLPQKKR